ncbi:unnamed protein product, partial [Darwinula stevensoni]
LSLEIPHAPQIFLEREQAEVEISIDIDATRLQEEIYEIVILGVKMYKLVLIRHGESTWNLENRFTGWVDVDLTPVGVLQAQQAGQTLLDHGFCFDIAYTSVLKRAIRTLWYVQDAMDLMWIPTVHAWRLNERHYGALAGLNKTDTVEKYGEDQLRYATSRTRIKR